MAATLLRRSLTRLMPAGDAELLRRFADRRDEPAFAELMRRHGPTVFGVCRSLLPREDAEDAFQTTFAALARRAGSLARPEALLGWLCGTARRTALAMRRANRRRRHRESVPRQQSFTEPADEMTWREVRVAVAEEVERLAGKYRDAFTLCVEQGLSRSEAGDRLGIPEGTVNSRLHEAKSRLRDRLSRRGVDLSAALAAVSLSAEAVAVSGSLMDTAMRTAMRPAGALSMFVPLLAAVGVAVAMAGVVLLGSDEKPSATESPPTEGHIARTDAAGDPLPELAVNRLGTLRWRDRIEVNALAVSPDGQHVLSTNKTLTFTTDAYPGSLLCRYDAETGRPSWPFRLGEKATGFQANRIAGIGFANDGTAIVAFPEGKVFRCDPVTGRALSEADIGGISTAMFSPDGRSLFTLTVDNEIRRHDVRTGRRMADFACRLDIPRASHDSDRVLTEVLAVSPDGKVIAVSERAGKFRGIRLYDTETAERLGEIPLGSTGYPIFAPGGKRLIVWGDDRRIEIWDVATRKLLREIRRPVYFANVDWATLSPDGTRLALPSLRDGIAIWDLETGKVRTRLDQDGTQIRSTAFSRDGKTLYAGTGSAILRWDVDTGKRLDQTSGHTAGVQHLAFTPDGDRLVSLADDQVILFWAQPGGRELRRLHRYNNAMALSPDGRTLAVSDPLGVRMLDLAKWRESSRLPTDQPLPLLTRLAFSEDGRELTVAGDFLLDGFGGHFSVWPVGADEPSVRREIERRHLSQITLSPGGERLAWINANELEDAIQVWDTRADRLVCRLPVSGNPLRTLAFSPDAKRLVTASGHLSSKPGEYIRIWDLATGKQIREIPSHAVRVAFSSDGRILAAATSEGKIQLWELATGRKYGEFVADPGEVTAMRFSPNGRTLAVGSSTSTILLFDASQGAGAKPGIPEPG